MATEKVSVIIPLYNAQPFLQATIESILNQSFQQFRLYIIDDQSSDGSADIALEYARKLPDKVTYYRLEERAYRPSVGKNTGIKMCRGEYVAFIDHDDWWEPDHLEALVNYLDSHPNFGTVGSNGFFYDEAKKKVLGTYRPTNELLDPKQTAKLTLAMPPYLTSSCFMIRRRVFDDLGSVDEALGMSDDHEIMIRQVASGQFHLVMLSKPTIHRRWLSTSFSNHDRAMELISQDSEAIYAKFSNSPHFDAEEKQIFRQWRYLFKKRWANYLLSTGQYKKALEIYREVQAAGFGDKQVALITSLAKVIPPLAGVIARQKREWSLQHPGVYSLGTVR